MFELILTAGPVFAVMLSPLLVPVLGWSFGKLSDPFRPAAEPGIAERLAERRRVHVEVPQHRGQHVAEELRAA